VSNPVADVQYADVFIVIGSNPTVNHPVAATFMKNAIERGAKLILMDPRRTELSRLATHMLQFKPGTDVALLNAMLHTIVFEGLVNERFVEERTEGFEEMKRRLIAYSPEAMEPICGIPAETIREAARLYATSKASMIFWGMGVSQHVHGTDNARCLITLALLTGQIGRRGTGLHPLRGQNNVQGASDVGLIPMMYPDYQSVESADARASFEALNAPRSPARRDLEPEPPAGRALERVSIIGLEDQRAEHVEPCAHAGAGDGAAAPGPLPRRERRAFVARPGDAGVEERGELGRQVAEAQQP